MAIEQNDAGPSSTFEDTACNDNSHRMVSVLGKGWRHPPERPKEANDSEKAEDGDE